MSAGAGTTGQRSEYKWTDSPLNRILSTVAVVLLDDSKSKSTGGFIFYEGITQYLMN